MRTYLVSGGDGFIGRNLVHRLANEGNRIIVVDNHITSYKHNDTNKNVFHFDEPIETFDISKIDKVDIIFHLASVASPLVYKSRFKAVYNANVHGTERLLELAKRDSALMVYTSTSEVYGMVSTDQERGKGMSEDSKSISHLITSRSGYAVSKKMGEELVNDFIIQKGDGIILRLFNVYGPNMDEKNNGYGRVIPNFIDNIRKNKPLVIFGDGKQVRSFIWIDDCIDAMIEITHMDKYRPRVINIGFEEPTSILELSKIIFKITGRNTGIMFKEKDIDDPEYRKPDCTVLRSNTSWKPKVSLEKGLISLWSDRDV